MTAAVVTGAAKGIGLAIAEQLLADGAVVIALDRDGDALERETARLGDGYRPLVGDIGEWEDHERAAAAAERAGELRSRRPMRPPPGTSRRACGCC
jgi:NAD(P)-dependent dehydrogenase (short-subunit alcohol dehydrogenase family)